MRQPAESLLRASHPSLNIVAFIGVFVPPLRASLSLFFFFNDPAPPEISPLPLPDALPIPPAAQAVSAAADQIALGHADVAIAGGVESLSDIPILASRRLADILVEASKAKTLGRRIGAFSKIRPRDLVPVSPAIAEPSTGESMGRSAEKMAKENHITREAQDRWALRSHRLA